MATRDVGGEAIRFFATGGIGGVHRNWAAQPDVSADLAELARTPVCVVSAGCKSLLDVAATRETLEAMGVPVIGYKTDVFPWFYARPAQQIPVSAAVAEPAGVIGMCDTHWRTLQSDSAILLCQSPPTALLMDANLIERATSDAESEAEQRGIAGADRTPFVLSQVAEATSGGTLATNIVLLLQNAALASQLAVCWSAARG